MFSNVKRSIQKSTFLVLVVSRLYAFLNHIISLFWRYKVKFTCHVSNSAKIIGWRNVHLSSNCVISSGSWINVNNRGVSEGICVDIGKNTFLGRNNFLTVGRRISIGPYCLTASNCSFIGSSHVVSNPLLPYISTGVTQTSDIVVGTNCFFGYGASVLGSVKIGHGCIVGAHTVITKNVPPFSIVVGNPGVVIKRYDFEKSKWVRNDEYSESSIMSENEYIEKLENEHGSRIPFMPLSVSNTFFGDMP